MIVWMGMTACTPSVENPTMVNRKPSIYPDYIGVTIPADIAPMNFNIKGDTSASSYIFNSIMNLISYKFFSFAGDASDINTYMNFARNNIHNPRLYLSYTYCANYWCFFVFAGLFLNC